MAEFIDRRLLRQVAGGDDRALAELYDRHAGLVAMRLRRRGASVAEAEDVLQETFLQAWRSAATYRGEGAVAAWLWAIANHKYLSLARREARGRAREATVQPLPGWSSDEDGWVLSIDVERALGGLAPDLSRECSTPVRHVQDRADVYVRRNQHRGHNRRAGASPGRTSRSESQRTPDDRVRSAVGLPRSAVRNHVRGRLRTPRPAPR